MKIGDKVEVIGHTKGGGQQFDVGEIVEVIRVSDNGTIKCSNGGNEQWWLDPSEYKIHEPFDIHSLHGQYFSATIVFYKVVGRILVTRGGGAYLCQDSINGCARRRDFLGYKHGWHVLDFDDLADSHVFGLKLLPSPIEYHLLFQEILEKRGPTWDEDGNYSVIPNEVMDKIAAFMERVKEFEPKNLGNNQNKL